MTPTEIEETKAKTTAIRSEQDAWQVLETVMDPELPIVSVVELGIIRQVALEGARIRVTLTPTFSACPALRVMQDEIQRTLQPFFAEVVVNTQLSPPWSSDWITESARVKLEAFGVAPPQPTGPDYDEPLITLQAPPTRCPYCGSFDTALKNPFGPTLCKALLYCNRCREPFEGFKTI